MEKFLNNLWKWKCGIPEEDTTEKKYTLQELQESEWSPEFEELCRNRLIIGALRYGRLNARNKPKYDRVNSIIKRLQEYQKTGNTEYLVDCANICMLEFEEGDHPLKHFDSIDDGEHTKIRVGRRSNDNSKTG